MEVRPRNNRLGYPLGGILWFAGELKMYSSSGSTLLSIL